MLRKMKLGRVKIIPLQGTTNPKTLKIPNREGISGSASALHEIREKQRTSRKLRFRRHPRSCRRQNRFRTFKRRLPSRHNQRRPLRARRIRKRLLPRTHRLLHNHSQRKRHQQPRRSRQSPTTASFPKRHRHNKPSKKKLSTHKTEITRLTESINTLDREVTRVKRSVKRTQINVRRVEKYRLKLEKETAAEKGRMRLYLIRKKLHLRKNFRNSKLKWPTLRKKTDVAQHSRNGSHPRKNRRRNKHSPTETRHRSNRDFHSPIPIRQRAQNRLSKHQNRTLQSRTATKKN